MWTIFEIFNEFGTALLPVLCFVSLAARPRGILALARIKPIPSALEGES